MFDVESTDAPEKYPAYKHEFVKKCQDIDGVVTEIVEERYGHKYHAGIEDSNGTVWMATIETDNGEGLDGEPRVPDVTFRKCHPGAEVHVLYSWSTVAVKALYGPSDLDSWRTIMSVFHAADELLKTHSEPVDYDSNFGGDDGD